VRIAIEASSLLDHHGGFRTYLEKLIEHLALLDRETEYLLYVARWAPFPPASKVLPPLPGGSRVRTHFRRFPYRLLLNLEHRLNFRVQERFLLPPLDLFHGACQVLPHPPKAPSVLTVHHFSDMRFHPGAFERFYYGKVYENSIRGAARIITVSKYTKDFLVERFRLDPERITPVYHGIFDPRPEVSAQDIVSLRERYALPERFVVCVSRINPGKNTVSLVRAFAQAARKREGLGLVLVGWANPDYLVQVRETIAAAGIGDRVILTGPVPDDDIPRFYAAAELFAHASTSEGFGIPLIEAMAMGCPVAASDATAIPEVLGGAGLLFDPADEESITDALCRVLDDPAFRAELVEKGLERAKDFSWETAARCTLDVYRAAL